MPAVVPNLDTVDNSNDLHHLRQTYIHLFPLPACRISEYVSGTSLGGPEPAPEQIFAAMESRIPE
jgi:hypothetical protein